MLGPTVGCWCETSSDFDLLVELIAHVLADRGSLKKEKAGSE